MLQLRGRDRPARRRDGFHHPARVIAGGFAFAVVAGTALLSIPAATHDGTRAHLDDAVFTATSAVSVTGLITVDTGTSWSRGGLAVILVLIQAGGLGIMTFASLFALLVSRRLGVRFRLAAQAETRSLTAVDVRRVVRNVVVFALLTELVCAVVLAARFATAYRMPVPVAAWHGAFDSVSAFDNAGFSLWPDSFVRYAADPVVSLVVAGEVIVGGLGFPVVFELLRAWRRPRTWSVLTRITATVTVVLLVGGTVLIVVAEGSNPATLGTLDGGHRLVASFFAAVMPRTAGFDNLDIAAQRPETLLVTQILMFIGGGSASTAGGIKVTTFGLLGYVMWAEARGHPTVDVGRRQVPQTNQRQALAVALLGIGLVVGSTFLLLLVTPFSFDETLFEATSAFATVGLSTGVTRTMPDTGRVLLIVLMFAGRIGPLTLASALALRERRRSYELPMERTIVG